jgi:hypothetical protein
MLVDKKGEYDTLQCTTTMAAMGPLKIPSYIVTKSRSNDWLPVADLHSNGNDTPFTIVNVPYLARALQ